MLPTYMLSSCMLPTCHMLPPCVLPICHMLPTYVLTSYMLPTNELHMLPTNVLSTLSCVTYLHATYLCLNLL